MKFKAGDRVIVKHDSLEIMRAFRGKPGSIGLEVGYFSQLEVLFDVEITEFDRCARDWFVNEKHLELESVYHSPLYKALT
jgi:hypothetical protein